jgi:putative spermidine/putrescine transport system ATP-binding protein
MTAGGAAATVGRDAAPPAPGSWRERLRAGLPGWRAKAGGAGGGQASISFRRVSKTLGTQEVLAGIDLDIAAGEFFTLLGPSGSGKTTLLMTLAGFVMPDAGQVWLGGRDITALPAHLRDIGIVFQSYALFPHMSVAGNIAYPLKLRGVARAESERRVAEALQLVQLPGFGERSVASLSGGQRQRVALARAVVFRPRILLMDEPLSALDKPLREAMQIELRRLHAELGLTTVYVTHDQKEALTLSDRIGVMLAGRLAEMGAPQQLYRRPRTAVVARFLGESTILEVELRRAQVFFRGSEIRAGEVPPGRRHGLLIRPERLQVLRPGAPLPAAMIRFAGTVRDVIFQGESHRSEIVTEDGTSVILRTAPVAGGGEAVPVPGQRIEVGLAAEDAAIVAHD